MAHKPNPFYKLLKAETLINITSKPNGLLDSVNRTLSDACETALKQPFPGEKFIFNTVARFRRAGFALLIEENPDQKIQTKQKFYAPVAFESKIFVTQNVNLFGRVFGKT